ncbi:alpha/beta fold hydrolase [Microbacterium sp. cx-59]|uniref:alpha/beta fold hydrolase n=1 Tax=Microbacterium sp. cx-59 TaxID=2891207 RepID=UPI001E5D635A|nr:alpha/beta fold hydrolase [Microbacterium sp. cx-59]MCC4908922.1 lipase family protein [Microbacterium sp. cx-59]
MRSRHPVTLALGAAAAILVVLIAADAIRRVTEGEAEKATDAAFYAPPSPMPTAAPGTVIRSEPIASAPAGTTAWRLLYHSQDLAGADIPVSGVLIVPDGAAPPGGRTIVSWAHPTTGAAPPCAPSLAVDPFQLIEGLHELLAAGYAIVATDYPGLGVAIDSSYLLGVPAAHRVLDAARAARSIDEAHIGDRLLLWGHSQGGQAALFAAERAAAYAPELTLEGVAVAAPAADLAALMTDDIVNLSGTTIASFAIPAYEAAYADRYPGGEITAILTPAGAKATPEMAALCLTQAKEIHGIADPLVGAYVSSDPATTEPWQTLLHENSAGGQPLTVPVFVGQGLADTLVIPSATEGYVRLLCAQQTDVTFHTFPDVTHALAAYASLPAVLEWFAEVEAGQRPNNC